MTENEDVASLPPRVPTGVRGLDELLQGGLFKGGIYVVGGAPGTGKTTFANQTAFHHVTGGGRVVYVTLLSESHGRMLSHLNAMTFFDPKAVGRDLLYLNGFATVESEGLQGLLKLLRRTVRDHRADLLILDGMLTAEAFARSGVDYKKFINELQTWVAIVGCTVVFLTSTPTEASAQPEHSMVDGIFELQSSRIGLRWDRQLTVTKFRGSAFIEGSHGYRIGEDGLVVHPRLEAVIDGDMPPEVSPERMSTGVEGLDQMLEGGLAADSTTLLIGSSGSGKTTLGLHFLAAAQRDQQKAVLFGFFESKAAILRKSASLGLPLGAMLDRGQLTMSWSPPAEVQLDEVGARLLELVRRTGARRLLVDGLSAFRQTAHPERLSGFLCALSLQLQRLGVTTVVTEEMRQLFVTNVEAPAEGVSAIFHNIVFLRHVDAGMTMRRLMAVMKTRDSAHDRALRSFEITGKGIVLQSAFGATDSTMTGSARGGSGLAGGNDPGSP